MDEQFKMIEEIKAETKIFRYADLRTLFFVIGFLFFGYLISGSVYEAMQIPFIVFNGIVGLVLSIKSPFNRGKCIYQSILLFFRSVFKGNTVYHPVNVENNDEDIIEESQMMYKKLDNTNMFGGGKFD